MRKIWLVLVYAFALSQALIRSVSRARAHRPSKVFWAISGSSSAVSVSDTGDDNNPAPQPYSLSCGPNNTDFCEVYLNVTADGIAFHGPTSYSQQIKVEWENGPRRVLCLAKPDEETLQALENAVLALWKRGLTVLVERAMYEHLLGAVDTDELNQNSLEIFDRTKRQGLDFCMTFGGDGLLMHANALFSGRAMPPIMAFDFGSLGFLCPFHYQDFEKELDSLITQGCTLTLRQRLKCSVMRPAATVYSGDGVPDPVTLRSNLMQIGDSKHVLNEMVIDRGPSSFLSVLDIVCDGQFMTTLQGDGIIIASPTGSTAYSLAAGGSMVHPTVPGILLTPICAHTLSFRPLILPDSCVLQCYVPVDCRASGWVSFDGKFRQELQRGDCIQVEQSLFPMPTINHRSYTSDWFDALRSGFMFNERPRQSSAVPAVPEWDSDGRQK